MANRFQTNPTNYCFANKTNVCLYAEGRAHIELEVEVD